MIYVNERNIIHVNECNIRQHGEEKKTGVPLRERIPGKANVFLVPASLLARLGVKNRGLLVGLEPVDGVDLQ